MLRVFKKMEVALLSRTVTSFKMKGLRKFSLLKRTIFEINFQVE